MGPSRVNPTTGQILDADVIFDADLVEFRRAVERDISLGAPPGAAAAVRALNTGIRTTGADATPGQPPPRPPSRP